MLNLKVKKLHILVCSFEPSDAEAQQLVLLPTPVTVASLFLCKWQGSQQKQFILEGADI